MKDVGATTQQHEKCIVEYCACLLRSGTVHFQLEMLPCLGLCVCGGVGIGTLQHKDCTSEPLPSHTIHTCYSENGQNRDDLVRN